VVADNIGTERKKTRREEVKRPTSLMFADGHDVGVGWRLEPIITTAKSCGFFT
jgi:hypothetical protein